MQSHSLLWKAATMPGCTLWHWSMVSVLDAEPEISFSRISLLLTTPDTRPCKGIIPASSSPAFSGQEVMDKEQTQSRSSSGGGFLLNTYSSVRDIAVNFPLPLMARSSHSEASGSSFRPQKIVLMIMSSLSSIDTDGCDVIVRGPDRHFHFPPQRWF